MHSFRPVYCTDVRARNTLAENHTGILLLCHIYCCMGLFGLSAINAVNRTKEIGIRKILGASVRDIVSSLSRSFVVIVSLAVIIATPLAWWIMHKWLENFTYRISITWWIFAVAGLAALLIAMLATGYQAVKAAMTNPVKSLRTE